MQHCIGFAAHDPRHTETKARPPRLHEHFRLPARQDGEIGPPLAQGSSDLRCVTSSKGFERRWLGDVFQDLRLVALHHRNVPAEVDPKPDALLRRVRNLSEINLQRQFRPCRQRAEPWQVILNGMGGKQGDADRIAGSPFVAPGQGRPTRRVNWAPGTIIGRGDGTGSRGTLRSACWRSANTGVARKNPATRPNINSTKRSPKSCVAMVKTARFATRNAPSPYAKRATDVDRCETNTRTCHP